MSIQRNSPQYKLIRLVEFYFTLGKKCHIKIKPTGFRNGKIVSEYFEVGSYFLFEDLRTPGNKERLFLDTIFDIKDYEEPIE